MRPIDGWWSAMCWPLAAFSVLATLFATTDADVSIARQFFFDVESASWLGTHRWWANELLHTGGGWLVRSVFVLALLWWTATFVAEPARCWRRRAAYILIAALLTVGTVGWLKAVTNVDCPWDLLAFGGRSPYVPLFGNRPDELLPARCFPAAHAGSGYALVACYFAVRDLGRRLARAGLTAAGAIGLIFGIAQQSRGAHFLSHDLWSAMIAWTICSGVYYLGFRGCLRRTDAAAMRVSTMPDERSLINMP